MTGATTRDYPLPMGDDEDDDSRFSAGLLHDVAEVIARHGYPPVTRGLDLVELQLSLAAFLYGPTAETRSEAAQTAAEPRTQAPRYEDEDTGSIGGTK